MPKPNAEIKELIRELEEPFARRNRRNTGDPKSLLSGESDDFTKSNFDATDAGGRLPPTAKKIKVLPETKEEGKYHRYLWIINDDGLFMQLEATPNPAAERKCLCHTNLTAGEKAYQGGELWFHTDGTLYLNYDSGRYGAETKKQRDGVRKYFDEVGYKQVKIMPPLKETDV